MKQINKKAISIKQPFADNLIYGARAILVEKNVDYRGELVVCSSFTTMSRYSTNYNRDRLGRAICMVYITSCVKVSELTGKQWKELTKLPESEKTYFRHLHVLIVDYLKMLNPHPVEVKKGIWNLCIDPELLAMDDESENAIAKRRDYSKYIVIILLILCLILSYFVSN